MQTNIHTLTHGQMVKVQNYQFQIVLQSANSCKKLKLSQMMIKYLPHMSTTPHSGCSTTPSSS